MTIILYSLNFRPTFSDSKLGGRKSCIEVVWLCKFNIQNINLNSIVSCDAASFHSCNCSVLPSQCDKYVCNAVGLSCPMADRFRCSTTDRIPNISWEIGNACTSSNIKHAERRTVSK
jgi:hypothetical protein